VKTLADVDKRRGRIAGIASSAYDLWVARNIEHAEIPRSEGAGGAAFRHFCR
jgi:hypothetical protein